MSDKYYQTFKLYNKIYWAALINFLLAVIGIYLLTTVKEDFVLFIVFLITIITGVMFVLFLSKLNDEQTFPAEDIDFRYFVVSIFNEIISIQDEKKRLFLMKMLRKSIVKYLNSVSESVTLYGNDIEYGLRFNEKKFFNEMILTLSILIKNRSIIEKSKRISVENLFFKSFIKGLNNESYIRSDPISKHEDLVSLKKFHDELDAKRRTTKFFSICKNFGSIFFNPILALIAYCVVIGLLWLFVIHPNYSNYESGFFWISGIIGIIFTLYKRE